MARRSSESDGPESRRLLGNHGQLIESQDHVVDIANEAQPLLDTDLPMEFVPDKWFQRRVMTAASALLAIIIVSQAISVPALQEIMEDVICRDIYPDHPLKAFEIIDKRCKDPAVQNTLAMVKSWSASCELLVPLAVQLPYGVIADKYGRQPILFASLLGIVFQQTWSLIVLLYPNTFSIWALLYGNAAFLIGGGGQVAVAMCYTIVVDTIPAAQRANAFYFINALTRIVAVAATPLAALLLSVDPWITLWIGYAVFIIGVMVTLFLPETLKMRQEADNKRRSAMDLPPAMQPMTAKLSRKSVVSQALFSATNDMSHVWNFLLGSRSIMFLIIASGTAYPIRLTIMADLLQYLTNRFHWTWSQGTYVTAVGNGAGVFMLVVALPLGGMMLAKRGYSTLEKDLYLTRVSAIFMTLGCIILAVAPVAWLCILSLVIFSASAGFESLVRAILSSVVEPHTIGTLNTVLGTMESLMGVFSSPTFGWLLSRGIEIGGFWMGLSFMVASIFGLITIGFVFAFRLPSAFARA